MIAQRLTSVRQWRALPPDEPFLAHVVRMVDVHRKPALKTRQPRSWGSQTRHLYQSDPMSHPFLWLRRPEKHDLREHRNRLKKTTTEQRAKNQVKIGIP